MSAIVRSRFITLINLALQSYVLPITLYYHTESDVIEVSLMENKAYARVVKSLRLSTNDAYGTLNDCPEAEYASVADPVNSMESSEEQQLHYEN